MGLAVGLATAPLLPDGGPPGPLTAILLLLPALLLLIDRAGPLTLVLIALTATVAGLLLGAWRIGVIEDAAFAGRPGSSHRLVGFLLEAPRRTTEGWKAPVETPDGRLLVEASGDLPSGPGPGAGIEVEGTLREAPPWLAAGLRARGIELAIEADRVRFGTAFREGVQGVIDSIRARAEAAIEYGIPAPQSALARGFVLGQDQAIAPPVIESFRDSGLAHLLAVSGQNVMLLLLLGWVALAAVGLPLRYRYPILAGLVCLYVPLAGGGPSIQRAGIMGLAGLAAASAGRPLDRVFPVALAACLTLALNPFAFTDVGWQLSFAAVLGILLLAKPLARRMSGLSAAWSSGVGAALATGAAVTVAASVATLPLIGLHFGKVPMATVAANLFALPAVAPSMWLGMLSATVGQIAPWLALPFNLINSVLLAFIGGVADWLGAPDQVLEVGRGPGPFLILSFGSLLAVIVTLRVPRMGTPVVAALVLLPLAGLVPGSGAELPRPPDGGIAVDALDVGQGDAILIRPSSGDPILVDAGPPGGGVVDGIAASGHERIGGMVLTHLDRDHVGGFGDVLEGFDVGSVIAERMTGRMREAARAEGASIRRVGLGDRFRAGPARIEVLWPPAHGSTDAVEDRNARSVVLLVEFAGRRILLTGDAESELVPLDPGPLDVLKVAHHGSEDTGLERMLARTGPLVSLLSSGTGNPYGHPVPLTVGALERHGSAVYRTDLDGSISVLIGPAGRITVETTD